MLERVNVGNKRAGGFKRSGAFRIGFVPMIDCAPLIVAREFGLFKRFGVRVELSREAGWATVREKMLHAELDGAHTHASMAYAIHCGIGTVARACVTGLVLNLNGNAITLSNELWDLGVRDAATLFKVVKEHRGRRTFVFAHVMGLSAQHFVLRQWLRSGGIDPDRDVRLVVVPSMLVHENLRAGYVDGYCVGEPWSSVLLASGEAWSPTTSGEICPLHPEKIFLVLQDFANTYPHEHGAMLAALIEACRYCDDPAKRPDLVRLLAREEYLNLPERVLANCLIGPFDTGRGTRRVEDLIVYHRHDANAPTRARAKWVYHQIAASGLAKGCFRFRRDTAQRIFREDLYEAALATLRHDTISALTALNFSKGLARRHPAATSSPRNMQPKPTQPKEVTP